MNWIKRYPLLLCILLVLLFGIYMILFHEGVQLSSATWTAPILFYFLLLSILIRNEQQKVQSEDIEGNEDNTQKNTL
ncbi:hypothetical protein [Fredinandcohnia quinoae]|uniref:Uncharacterized protein n=1 Tax=Fredinandcohnia quinoae TaxID=2918902 RepID=A0AAW5DWR7_9BACI|nr:hypothetical protein [Fredinandcohnia sp. SECRCQ15]MCH1625081.1 hypothetical protein [Fredinandcohnia sp. SECRCQ15]